MTLNVIAQIMDSWQKLSELEQIAPTKILMYTLGDNTTRVYRRIMVTKAALVAEYAMPH